MITDISTRTEDPFTASSPNQPDYIRHGYDWYHADDSAQGEPLALESLTRYGQPISCSIVYPGWVFISYGQDNLCIREQNRMIHLQNYVVVLSETDFSPDQETSVGWVSSSDQRMSALAAGYPPNVPEEDLQAPLHPIIRAFGEGIADIRPEEHTRETAALIVEAATMKAVAKEIEVDDEDGALSFELRLDRGLLVVGELSIEGNLHINVYNDRHPDPDATIDDIWIKHLPQASVDDLMNLL